MARLLSPSEIGVYSITAVLVSFTQVFRDFGVVAYIKRQKDLTPEILQSATGVLFTTSWLIAALLYLSTDLWVQFFGQVGIREIMPILALGFIFIPFGSVPQAVLTRSLEVTKTTSVNALSTAAYIATCVALAALDFGYMSMAWANLAGIVISGIALTLLMPKGLPFWPSFSGWGKVMHFGAGSMLTSSLKSLDTALPDLVLGKLSTAHNVGIFSRANSTVNIINTVTGPTINYFALPHLAKVYHAGRSVNEEMIKSIALITGVIWPVLAVTGVLAKEIITVLYGMSWAESAVVVPYLCVVFGIQAAFSMLQSALTAVGRPYTNAAPLACSLTLKFCLSLALFDGTLQSFGLAICAGEILTVPVYLFIGKRSSGIELRQWAVGLNSSVLVSIAVLSLTLTIAQATSNLWSSYLHLLFVGCAGFLTWLLALAAFRHPLMNEIRRIRDTK